MQAHAAQRKKLVAASNPSSNENITLRVGQVLSVAPLAVRLDPEALIRPAQLAASTLLQPEVGDTVLVSCGCSALWVLAVLVRQSRQSAQLAVPGAHAVTLSAPDLSLQATSALRLSSADLDVQAQTTAMRLGVLRLSVRAVQAAAGRIQLWANLLHTRARSLAVSAEQRVTQISQVDLLQAGQMRIEGEQLVQLRARQVQVQAKETVVVDGKQILMG